MANATHIEARFNDEDTARERLVANVTAKTVAPILREQVAKKARLMTNEAKVYEAR